MNDDIAPAVDVELRVLLTTSEDAYIIGSCHTFPGRMSVWVPSDRRARCVSKSDIAESSAAAAYWVRGFLAGSVPEPPEDPALEAAWLRARDEFLTTGQWHIEA